MKRKQVEPETFPHPSVQDSPSPPMMQVPRVVVDPSQRIRLTGVYTQEQLAAARAIGYVDVVCEPGENLEMAVDRSTQHRIPRGWGICIVPWHRKRTYVPPPGSIHVGEARRDDRAPANVILLVPEQGVGVRADQKAEP